MLLKDHAETIAAKLSPGSESVGFAILPVIEFALPLFIDFYETVCTQAGTVREVIERQRDDKGNCNQLVLAVLRPRMRRAARRAGQRELDIADLDRMTAAVLDHAREMADQDLASAMTEATVDESNNPERTDQE